MRNTLLAVASMSVLFIGGSAMAGAIQTQQPTATKVSATSSDPVICKYGFYEGMVFRSNDCHTASEWQNIRFRTQNDITIIQTRGLARN